MKARTGKILLIFAGVILACLMAEFLVRVFLPQGRLVTWIEMHPRGFMMNQPNMGTIHHARSRNVHYHLGEFGIRGNEAIQKESTKILLLGDSFTFGLLLDQQDTYASLIQTKIDHQLPSQDIQVLNGGVGGAGLADWPAWLEEEGEGISPDIVLLFLNYMDVDRAISKNLYVIDEQDSVLVNSTRWKPKSMFMKLGRMGWYQWLQAHSEVMDIIVKIAWRYLYFSDQTDGFSQEHSKVLIPSQEDFDPGSGYSLQLAQLLVKRIDKWCDQHDCTFILTTTGFFEENKIGVHTDVYYNSLIKNPETDIPFFDNTPCVKEKISGDFDSIRIQGDTHPNERGAEIIANCTMNWLQPFIEQQVGKP